MFKRVAALFFCIMLVMLCLLPSAGSAEENPKVVRVGWYDTPFNFKDAFGRRTGYAYEYQRKIAAYTGWKYEYVEGNWPELLDLLKQGKIDLMSDVSFAEDRTEYMLYSAIPMGEELYYLYITPDNKEISADDFSTLNGKTVGVTKGTVQRGQFLAWAEARGISVEILDLECSEAESLQKLNKGEMDAFVTLDTYGDPNVVIPLWKIGASDFYFAVSKARASHSG